jgi:general stress protein 26
MKRFLLILVPIIFISGQTKSKTFLSEHLTGLKPFIGNTYKGNFINSTKENPMTDVLSFERALNGNAVKVTHSVNNGEYGGETMVMWNSEKEGLQSWYFTSAGSLTIQNVQIKKDTFISIEDVAANKNGITKVKTIIEVLHGNQIQKRTKYLMNNLWKDGSEIIYNKVNDLKPVFN